MARRLPPLIALKAFEAVGRIGTVRAAGEELAVSHTAISRHLRHLEERLGVVLMVPRGRRLVMTPAGARFHQQIVQAFDLIDRAAAELTSTRRGSLTLWCPPGLAAQRILPHLPDLEMRLPGCEIRLHPTLARPDFTVGEADAEITYCFDPARPWPGLQDSPLGISAELLARPSFFPVASPGFRAAHPGCDDPAALSRLSLLHEESAEQWRIWFQAVGVMPALPLRGPKLWHAHLAIGAARLGQGVALANRLQVAEDLASGGLVVLTEAAVQLGGYYLIAPEARWQSSELSALRDWAVALFDHSGAID